MPVDVWNSSNSNRKIRVILLYKTGQQMGKLNLKTLDYSIEKIPDMCLINFHLPLMMVRKLELLVGLAQERAQ